MFSWISAFRLALFSGLTISALATGHAQEQDAKPALETDGIENDHFESIRQPDTDTAIDENKAAGPNKSIEEKTDPPAPKSRPVIVPVKTMPTPRKKKSRRRSKKSDVVLSTDGKSLHVIGSITSGLAAKLKDAIEDNSDIKTIALSSSGGLLIEGLAMAEIIRDKKLNTYVEYICASACTMAFLAGEQRIMGSDARLGFHQATTLLHIFLPKAEPDENSVGNQVMRNAYNDAGLDPAIIENTMNTSPRELWFPDRMMLIDSGLATRITGRDEFAVNAGKIRSASDLTKQLTKDPVMQAAADLKPYIFRITVAKAWIKAGLGGDSKKLLRQSRRRLFLTLLSHIAPVSDDVIDRYISLETDIWGNRDDLHNDDCEASFRKWHFPVGAAETADHKKRQELLLISMIVAASDRPRFDKVTQDQARARIHVFWAKMIAKYGYTSVNVARNFCREPLNYFEVLADMPKAQRIDMFRSLAIASRAATTALQ